MILFTHIPRTSGKYIERNMIPHHLRRVYKFHKKLMYIGQYGSYEIKKAPDVISGHIPYGLHRYLVVECDTFQYITFLREPIHRWISEFNHAMRFPRFVKPIWEKFKKPIDFLAACLAEGRNTNVMTKQLSGIDDFTNVIQDHKNYMFMWAARKKEYSDSEMSEMLETAKYNLLYNYDFVGFMEERYYKQLCRYFGWKYRRKKRMNVSSSVALINWKDKKVRKMLKHLNRFDIELYDFALKSKL